MLSTTSRNGADAACAFGTAAGGQTNSPHYVPGRSGETTELEAGATFGHSRHDGGRDWGAPLFGGPSTALTSRSWCQGVRPLRACCTRKSPTSGSIPYSWPVNEPSRAPTDEGGRLSRYWSEYEEWLVTCDPLPSRPASLCCAVRHREARCCEPLIRFHRPTLRPENKTASRFQARDPVLFSGLRRGERSITSGPCLPKASGKL